MQTISQFMKKNVNNFGSVVLVVLVLLFNIRLKGQNTGINETGSTPDPSAGLDIDFTNKGLLIPRMTATERNGISSSANSLLIFNTTTECFQAYHTSTSSWINISCLGCQLPGAFVASAATNISTTSFDANWTASIGATTYYLDVDDNSDFSSPLVGYDNLNVGNVITHNITGLTSGTSYYYRVRASNACGTGSNTASITATTTSCPSFSDDYASTAGWTTQAGTLVQITGGQVENGAAGNTVDHRISKSLGGALSDVLWTANFDFRFGTDMSGVESGICIFMSDGVGHFNSVQDVIGVRVENGGGLFTFYKDGAGPHTTSGQIIGGMAANTWYYCTLTRTSATNLQFEVFTDAARTTQFGSTSNQTIPTTVQTLSNVQHSTTDDGSTGNGQTWWYVDNLDVCDGASSQ